MLLWGFFGVCGLGEMKVYVIVVFGNGEDVGCFVEFILYVFVLDVEVLIVLWVDEMVCFEVFV